MNIIIIRGLTGTGKTTLLREIVSKFNFEKVEIDDIKREKYNTTEKCNPEEDYPEAGKRTKELVNSDKNVVIEEPFTDLKHIDLFKQGFDEIDKHNIIYIFLKTSLSTAIERKKGILNPHLVKAIYTADIKVDQISGELIFDTDKIGTEEIIKKLEKIL